MGWRDHTIDTVEEFREFHGDAIPAMYAKVVDHIDHHIRDFLALTTFVAVASIDADGNMDVSPKGDPAGFIEVIDDRTLAIPERVGNRRADTFVNVLQNPSVGLMCLVPGMDETMRINGRASVTNDPDLLEGMTVHGHTPKLAMIVEVEEAFIHCGKAPKRARLWDEDAWVDRSVYPTVGEVMYDHGDLGKLGFTREYALVCGQEDYDRNMYPVDA